MITIEAKPFDWNEPMAQDALPYCAVQSIGMALAKLNLLEEQGAKAVPDEAA